MLPTFSETVRYQIKHKTLLRIVVIYFVALLLFTLLYFISFAIRMNSDATQILNQFSIEQKFSDSISSDLVDKNIKLCNSFDCSSIFIINSKNNEVKLSYPSKAEKTSPLFLKNEKSSYWFGHLVMLSFNQFLLRFSDGGVNLFVTLSMNGYFRILLSFLVLFIVITVAFYLTAKGVAKEVSILLEAEINKLMSLTKGTEDKVYPRTKEILFLYEHILKQSKLAAIGQLSAMIAHDVRKPFSLLRTVLNMFDVFKKEPGELETAKRDIEKSIRNVESMLSDIMDFSRNVKIETKPSNLTNLIDFSIRQTAQSYENSEVTFKYDLKYTYRPLLNDERMTRVLGNIISNAVEAKASVIDISVIDSKLSDGSNGTSIIIGNNGPPFEPEDLTNLFDAFFTKGKAQGTGLGLASAQKIVKLHNGEIIARNRINKPGVEFIITIPSSNVLSSTINPSEIGVQNLPSCIKEAIVKRPEGDETEIETIVNALNTKEKFNILLLEDETLYRASVKNTIKKNAALDKMITVYDADTVEEALKLLQSEKITHAIVDIDLGQIKNGFDFLQEVHQKYPKLLCMIHSNRQLPEDKKKAKATGVKMFVPKPLSIEHLAIFLANKQ